MEIEYSKFEKLGRISWIIAATYFFSVHLISDFLWLANGGSFAYTGYFILLHLGFLLGAGLLYWKYDHPLSMIARFFYLALFIYVSLPNLGEEFYYEHIMVVIFGFLMFVCFLINVLVLLTQTIKQIRAKTYFSALFSAFKSKTLGKLVLLSLLGFAILAWSYLGFSQSITIQDTAVDGDSDMRVSFYGYPFGSVYLDYYNTSAWLEEAAYYRDLNTTFIPPWGITNHLPQNNATLANRAALFHELEVQNITFMLDIGPFNEENQQTDFFSYYYVAEMNATIDTVVAWIEEEGFTNFRGIEIDPEGPKWATDNQGNAIIPNATQHAYMATSLQNKFDELALLHPKWEFTSIAVPTAMFDYFDGDYDNDILLKSISSTPLDLDYYGWQTYMVQPDRKGSAEFYEYYQIAMHEYGQKTIPWIGWLNSYTELAENPATYENAFTQLKICKSLEVDEMIFAPSRYFLGMPGGDFENSSQALAFLEDVNQTVHTRFDSFSIPYHQDARLYEDPNLWIEKVHSSYISVNSNVFKDLLCELQFGWLFWAELGIISLIVILSFRKSRGNSSPE